MNNTSVESFLQEGCGRCAHFQTPQCKVNDWRPVLVALRAILTETELAEEMKWGSPCYTVEGKNVLMLSARRDAAEISLFQGAGIEDPYGLLEAPGENSRYARTMKFRSLDDVEQHRAATVDLVERAIAFKRSGKTIDPGEREPVPAELEDHLAGDPQLQAAFQALTPGRQRSYILHVGGAKQGATRARRAEKCAPKILSGKGFNER